MRAGRGRDTKVAGPECSPASDGRYGLNGFTKNRMSEMSST